MPLISYFEINMPYQVKYEEETHTYQILNREYSPIGSLEYGEHLTSDLRYMAMLFHDTTSTEKPFSQEKNDVVMAMLTENAFSTERGEDGRIIGWCLYDSMYQEMVWEKYAKCIDALTILYRDNTPECKREAAAHWRRVTGQDTPTPVDVTNLT